MSAPVLIDNIDSNKKNIMHFVFSYRFPASVIIAATVLTGCQKNGAADGSGPLGAIAFSASVYETETVRTRADGRNAVYITSDPYDIDFCIELNTKAENDETLIQNRGTYIVPSGYEGRLVHAAEGEMLDWESLTGEHTFYGWTMPWLKRTDDAGEAVEFPGKPEDSDVNGEYYIVEFPDSPESAEREEGKDENNAYLEKFLGTKAGPYSYVDHGKYVSLEFTHLVSKICVASMGLIKPDGSIDYAVKADMTFIGMPKKGKFYPHPADPETWPYVEPIPNESDYAGVTYFIANRPGASDYFYVCPELNFKDIGFKINLNNVEYGSEGDYYGDFSTVKFVREGPDGEMTEPEADEKILHAGEMMTLHIELIPGQGPGISIIIQEWNTDRPQESVHHFRPGIYTPAEVREVLDAFLNQKQAGQGGTTAEDIERLYEMYGVEKDVDGDGKKEKTFPLYDNVDVDSNIFPFPNGYILDGMGHTIKMRTNANNTNYVKAPYFNIGPVRDVWLTDGTHTIYIDKQGYVWLYDEDSGWYQTDNQLTELTGDEKSYDISCEDGTVHKSTYYNNNITGS